MTKLIAKIETLITPVLVHMGYEFVGCEFLPGQGKGCLRIYIDKPGGVNVSDCAKASRQIGTLLEVEAVMPGHYELEVSSPGVNRPIFSLAQFAKAVGQKVYIKLHVPLDERRQFTGVLQAVELDVLQVVCDEQTFTLPYSNVEKAHICADLRIG